MIEKYGEKDECGDIHLSYGKGKNDYAYLIDRDNEFTAIIYPYEKAIAQLIVHEVPKMNIKEVTYDALLKIPSKRGTGALGSSGK